MDTPTPQTAAPPRALVEAEIERLIQILDLIDGDPDREPDGDLEPSGDEDEPSLGANEFHHDQTQWAGKPVRPRAQDREIECEDEGAQCEDEGADIDGDPWKGEPSLGSLDRMTDQRGWAGGSSDDREQDQSDDEEDLGWPNPLGARLDRRMNLVEERVPTKRVRRSVRV